MPEEPQPPARCRRRWPALGGCVKIGIWCDYGTTLKPSEGIGVFVANLLQGLTQLPTPPQVVLLVSPCDPDVHRLLLQYARGLDVTLVGHTGGGILRLKVWLVQATRWAAHKIGGLLLRARRGHDVVASAPAVAGGAAQASPPSARRGLGARLRDWTLGWPRVTWRGLISQRYKRVIQQARQTACDIWLLPHPDTPDLDALNAPRVLLLFDLVYRHHAEGFSPARTAELFERTMRHAHAAERCVCAAEHVRRQDLLGQLGIATDRTAVIPLAAPAALAFARPTPEAELRRRHSLPRRFVFYPAAFRLYKNHAMVLRAADRLRRQHGLDVGVVFTGITTPPPYIAAEIAACGGGDYVRCLGDIPLADLRGLYECAAAMVFPSLHEGYGLPPVEALTTGCPLVCADLPVLREPLGLFADNVAFFDPRDLDDLCRKLAPVLQDRHAAVERQGAAARHVASRTWADVAAEWLALLERASAGRCDG